MTEAPRSRSEIKRMLIQHPEALFDLIQKLRERIRELERENLELRHEQKQARK